MHIFTSACKALQFIHNNNVIHRDIKSMNIFLTKENIVKVGDFGISRQLSDDTLMVQSYSYGTPLYASPGKKNWSIFNRHRII